MERNPRVKKNLSCYLCGEKVNFEKRQGKVRDNPTLEIYECLNCGLVFLSSFDHIFDHINDDFYELSGMHNGSSSIDLDSWLRETLWDDQRRFEYLTRVIENKSLLDFGCGNGAFLMLAKSLAKRVVGVEIERQLHEHFNINKLQVFKCIDEIHEKYNVITSFHVLEHIADPVSLLIKLTSLLDKDGTLIIEVPNANNALLTLYKCVPFSEFTYWSCHLFIYTEKTLSILAKKAGLKVNYIKYIQRYPLSNHLYWLANGKPGGHKIWNFLDSNELSNAYEKQLASIGCCDTILASFST